MTQNIAGAPPRHALQEIMKGERARDDHTVGILFAYQCIVRVARDAIERGNITENNPCMEILQTNLLEAQNALGVQEAVEEKQRLEMSSSFFSTHLISSTKLSKSSSRYLYDPPYIS